MEDERRKEDENRIGNGDRKENHREKTRRMGRKKNRKTRIRRIRIREAKGR